MHSNDSGAIEITLETVAWPSVVVRLANHSAKHAKFLLPALIVVLLGMSHSMSINLGVLARIPDKILTSCNCCKGKNNTDT